MRRSLTTQELKEKFGHPCELCKFFDMELSECNKGHRPRIYDLDDGPNEECHAKKQCTDFSIADLDPGPGIERAMYGWFAEAYGG